MNSIAIVLARGGSKRIPGKNLRTFRGQPLLAWPIKAALAWPGFTRVFISTDCPETESLACGLGAQSLGLRSAVASSDTAGTNEAVLECLQRIGASGPTPRYACALYATAAFVQSNHFLTASTMLEEADFDLVFPVVRFSYPIWRALSEDRPGGTTSFIWPEYAETRSQDLPPALHDAGQFYFFRTENFLNTGKLTSGRTGTFEVPETHCHDIDNPIDLEVAEIKHSRLYPDVPT
ncbi:MAG: acylneuraminate cytidylyltransferase family protein [Betaproteobacteria bacterium]|nr:acylneuraminate cytidylyltransferase family protein [Betaproteobacteria bacterium]